MDRIDCHQHLLYPEHFSYDWTAAFPVLGGKSFRVNDYRAATVTSQVRESIFMEVDVPFAQAVGEAAFFCELADDPANGISGVIAACRPEENDISAWLQATAHPRLVGYRRVLHTQPDELSTAPVFRENVARIGTKGLTFDLCILPRQHAIAAELIDACPGTRFVLDHCGVPDIAAGDLNFWKAGLKELSRRPNLACKISGIIAYASPERIEADTLRPVVEHVIDCFGWDRLVWGSDWPLCNLTRDMTTWITLLDEILAGCSQDELDRLYQRNVRRIYQLKPFAP
ncbi:amidohydrolase family protein [Luteolibacter arcticus]|uniref:Amidohydrolase family protein n=1 Tax=Luteolibacter arcticus TaxID=1581411 RepID=A0ABT3GK63_9BACT|nr:amidohydrolase family protein [Luteolibacter arcticus]MCW1923861.1 amidohydrolase family protein [Luteolibacter arcticus]